MWTTTDHGTAQNQDHPQSQPEPANQKNQVQQGRSMITLATGCQASLVNHVTFVTRVTLVICLTWVTSVTPMTCVTLVTHMRSSQLACRAGLAWPAWPCDLLDQCDPQDPCDQCDPPDPCNQCDPQLCCLWFGQTTCRNCSISLVSFHPTATGIHYGNSIEKFPPGMKEPIVTLNLNVIPPRKIWDENKSCVAQISALFSSENF